MTFAVGDKFSRTNIALKFLLTFTLVKYLSYIEKVKKYIKIGCQKVDCKKVYFFEN